MDESPSIDFPIPSRLVSSMDESPLTDCFFWSMDESPLIDCTAAGSFEIVVSCPVFEGILLPYRLTSFRVSERLKRPLAIPMCTVPYQSDTNPYSNFLSRVAKLQSAYLFSSRIVVNRDGCRSNFWRRRRSNQKEPPAHSGLRRGC